MPFASDSIDLTGTIYKFEEFVNHLISHDTNRRGSIYSKICKDPAYEIYKDWHVNSSLSGCAESDAYGRTHLIFYLWKEIGLTLEMGGAVCNVDTVKLVLDENDNTIHVYSVAPGNYLKMTYCAMCARDNVAC